MNAQELSALIKQAQTGDTEGYAQLYRAVYRPVYKIARMAMKSEDAAVEAVRLTACGKAYFIAAVHRMARKNTLH